MPQQSPPFFSYQAPGRIWQIKVDLATNCLGIEVRSQLQEVSFSYLCPLQNKVLFEGLEIEGALLTNLVACYKHVLLFQQLNDLENPALVTTLALDALSQEVLWAVTDYRHFFFMEEESIGKAGSTGEQEGWTAIHLKEGNIRELQQQEVGHLLTVRKQEQQEQDPLLLPVGFDESDDHFKTVAEFLQLYLEQEALKSCEYLHVFDKMLISFYTASGEKLTNHLAVFDAEGSLYLHQIIAEGLKQAGSETFMVWNQHLFFIDNSSCLKGYHLQ